MISPSVESQMSCSPLVRMLILSELVNTCTAPLECHLVVESLDVVILLFWVCFVSFSRHHVWYHITVMSWERYRNHPDTCEFVSLLLFLRVSLKNVGIFIPEDGNVSERLSHFHSSFSIKNNATLHINDFFLFINIDTPTFLLYDICRTNLIYSS